MTGGEDFSYSPRGNIVSAAILAVVSGLLLLALGLAYAVSAATPGVPVQSDTENIDVTIADKNGFNNFLVFEHVSVPSALFGFERYRVKFWVNDYTRVDSEKARRLGFVSGESVVYADFAAASITAGAAQHDTTVLSFDIPKSSLRTLKGFHVSGVLLFMDTGEVLEYVPADSALLKSAAGFVLR